MLLAGDRACTPWRARGRRSGGADLWGRGQRESSAVGNAAVRWAAQSRKPPLPGPRRCDEASASISTRQLRAVHHSRVDARGLLRLALRIAKHNSIGAGKTAGALCDPRHLPRWLEDGQAERSGPARMLCIRCVNRHCPLPCDPSGCHAVSPQSPAQHSATLMIRFIELPPPLLLPRPGFEKTGSCQSRHRLDRAVSCLIKTTFAAISRPAK